jgi:hypothetical protein
VRIISLSVTPTGNHVGDFSGNVPLYTGRPITQSRITSALDGFLSAAAKKLWNENSKLYCSGGRQIVKVEVTVTHSPSTPYPVPQAEECTITLRKFLPVEHLLCKFNGRNPAFNFPTQTWERCS